MPSNGNDVVSGLSNWNNMMQTSIQQHMLGRPWRITLLMKQTSHPSTETLVLRISICWAACSSLAQQCRCSALEDEHCSARTKHHAKKASAQIHQDKVVALHGCNCICMPWWGWWVGEAFPKNQSRQGVSKICLDNFNHFSKGIQRQLSNWSLEWDHWSFWRVQQQPKKEYCSIHLQNFGWINVTPPTLFNSRRGPSSFLLCF